MYKQKRATINVQENKGPDSSLVSKRTGDDLEMRDWVEDEVIYHELVDDKQEKDTLAKTVISKDGFADPEDKGVEVYLDESERLVNTSTILEVGVVLVSGVTGLIDDRLIKAVEVNNLAEVGHILITETSRPLLLRFKQDNMLREFIKRPQFFGVDSIVLRDLPDAKESATYTSYIFGYKSVSYDILTEALTKDAHIEEVVKRDESKMKKRERLARFANVSKGPYRADGQLGIDDVDASFADNGDDE